MIYSDSEARSLIIKACKTLVDENLIARTWGNVSARVSDSEFIITPSGMAYEDITPDDLVKVKIENLSYEGSIKPSSEKGVHAVAYSLRKDIGFIIHTHQNYASAISVLGKDTDFAPCASYGLPGTEKLKKAVEKTIKKNPGAMCFLMQRHGTVCLGKTYEEAFDNARKLEKQSKELFEKNKVKVSDSKKVKSFLDDYAQIMGPKLNPMEGEDAKAVCLISEKNTLASSYTKNSKPMNYFDVLIQNYVYRKKYSKLKDMKK